MLEIKEDDKFFSRLLSKESSTSNASFRVYYAGVPIGVPFVWEAKPGTPKHPSEFSQSENNEITITNNKKPLIFPPLTPPPSYSSLKHSKKSFSGSKKSASRIFHGLIPKMMIKHRRQVSSASTVSSSSDSTNTTTTTSTTTRVLGRSRSLSSPGSMFDLEMDDGDLEEEEEKVQEIVSSNPTSILCFGVRASRKVRSPSLGGFKV